MQQYLGVIIGFGKEKKKRVLSGINYNYKNEKLKIEKFQRFTGNNKEEMQKEIKSLIKQYPEVNTIYIVLKHARIDNIRRKLQLVIDHFQPYLDHICLIISDFQKSLDKESDQLSIQTKLKDYFNIAYCIQYNFGDSLLLDTLCSQSKNIGFEDFIRITLMDQKKIKFNRTIMELDININLELLEEMSRVILNQKLMIQGGDKQYNYCKQPHEANLKQSQPYEVIVKQSKPAQTMYQNKERNRAISHNNNQEVYITPYQRRNIFEKEKQQQKPSFMKTLFKTNK